MQLIVSLHCFLSSVTMQDVLPYYAHVLQWHKRLPVHNNWFNVSLKRNIVDVYLSKITGPSRNVTISHFAPFTYAWCNHAQKTCQCGNKRRTYQRYLNDILSHTAASHLLCFSLVYWKKARLYLMLSSLGLNLNLFTFSLPWCLAQKD